jgi:hypothetical protein
MYNNENDLASFPLNYEVGRGLCIACNKLRMLVTSEMILIGFSAKIFQAIFEKNDRSHAFKMSLEPEQNAK